MQSLADEIRALPYPPKYEKDKLYGDVCTFSFMDGLDAAAQLAAKREAEHAAEMASLRDSYYRECARVERLGKLLGECTALASMTRWDSDKQLWVKTDLAKRIDAELASGNRPRE